MIARRIVTLACIAGFPAVAQATNGMNMEGYGPIALGMGGAAMAYDVGNAGMINNPATLTAIKPGTQRLALFVGGLMPDVSSNSKGSAADLFVMPAAGYIRRDGNLVWGAGMMAQGGMGTEYSDGGFWGTLAHAGAAPAAGAMAAGQALRNLSEVGVGRVLLPLAYQVNDRLSIGGSLDYVWAGMDIQWLVDGAHFADMMPTGTRRFGAVSGTLVSTFQGMMPAPINSIGWGYFDFNQSGSFRQKANGNGWAGNLGFTFKASDTLTVGGVYHAKTAISDLETGSSDAKVTFNTNMGTIPLVGRVKISDFEWPETWALGLSWQASDRWQIAADYKRINWAEVMKRFRMTFTAAPAGSQTGALAPGFGGLVMNMDYFQNWRDQNVFMIGAGYKLNDATTLRFGVNVANNPVPDEFVSPLFPAVVTNHLTFGVDHRITADSFIHATVSHAPRVSVSNQWGAVGGQNQSISHSQTNWQLSYGYRF